VVCAALLHTGCICRLVLMNSKAGLGKPHKYGNV
jgi:hypothetical protein